MRAVVMRQWGPPDVLQLEDVPVPDIRPDEVLVKVGACGIPYHDIVQRNGAMRRGTEFPIILGYEIAGTVERIGALVTTLKPGDRVCAKPWNSCGLCRYCRNSMETACVSRKMIHGGYADYVALPEEVLVTIPDQMGFAAACTLGGAAGVSLNAVRDVAKVRLGDTMLITGASGGCGLPAMQIARAAGATVIAHSRSELKRAELLEAGAHHVVVADGGQDFSRQVKSLTGGKGVDIVVDNVGSRVFTPSFKCLALGGRYVLVGQLFREEISINPAYIFFQRAQILGVGSVRRDQLEDTVDLARAGVIKPKVAGVMTLEEIARAHGLVEAGDLVGRLVVEP